MAKTTEHIGKVAYMLGNMTEFFPGGTNDFEAAGITWQGMVQINNPNGTLASFAPITGEVEPSMFTAIMTKEEANALIKSWFVPEICLTCSNFYFQEYVRRFVPDSVFATMGEGWTDQQILKHLADSKTCKFITMTEYEGPLFDTTES